MLALRFDIWVPPPSRRAVLRCGGVVALTILATLLSHVAVPQAVRPLRPGACHRAPTALNMVGLSP